MLFARSQNRCAFPGCQEEIVDSTTGVVYGEVCHIEGVEAGAIRHNPNLDRKAINSESNIVMLCHKHHKLIDAMPNKFNVAWLKRVKRQHEIQGAVDISPSQAQSARLMLAEMTDVASHRTYNNLSHFETGDNTVKKMTINKKSCCGTNFVPFSETVGVDPTKHSYVKHLYDRLIEFKSKIPKYNVAKAGSMVSKKVNKLFGATWSNVPLSRYDAFVSYLQAEIDKTPIGRMNKTNGQKNYLSFDDFVQKV